MGRNKINCRGGPGGRRKADGGRRTARTREAYFVPSEATSRRPFVLLRLWPASGNSWRIPWARGGSNNNVTAGGWQNLNCHWAALWPWRWAAIGAARRNEQLLLVPCRAIAEAPPWPLPGPFIRRARKPAACITSGGRFACRWPSAQAFSTAAARAVTFSAFRSLPPPELYAWPRARHSRKFVNNANT